MFVISAMRLLLPRTNLLCWRRCFPGWFRYSQERLSGWGERIVVRLGLELRKLKCGSGEYFSILRKLKIFPSRKLARSKVLLSI